MTIRSALSTTRTAPGSGTPVSTDGGPSSSPPPPSVSADGAVPASRPARRPYLHLDESISRVVTTDFDVEAYTRKEYGRLPIDAERLAAQQPIPAPIAEALTVLQRQEATALAESRAMLATWTGREARVTAFLATWMVERYWLSRALRDLLSAAGPAPSPARAPAMRPAGRRARLRLLQVDRVQPLLAPLWSAVAGEAVTAGHMARMAIQEASLQAALRALVPQLEGEAKDVVAEVADRHEDPIRFFRAEASARITRSRREALTARAVLTLTSPLDGGGVPDEDLPGALAVIGADPVARAALHRARFEITRLLPRPDLPDPYLTTLPRTVV